MNDIPQDFTQALDGAGLAATFAAFPPSHRREFLKWVEEAKKPETRKARIGKAMTMIAAKRDERSEPRSGGIPAAV
ncbi:MAG: Bacteriocin-protection, YdeI or OmpD-Associated [Verrucomicrobiota bacterium]|jgi:uncharacterized protein YdeI (YjbR/CyaY-like superfamily)